MRTHPLRATVALALAAALLAQHPAAQGSTPVRQAPPTLLTQFDITRGTVQSMNVAPDPAGNYVVPVQLGPDQRTMVLTPYDLRGPGFQLMVEDATGLHQVPTPPCVTYRGSLIENATIKVAATIIDGSLTATIYEPAPAIGVPSKTWVVQPVSSVQPAAAKTVHIVYEATDNAQLPYQCGNATLPPQPLQTPVGTDITKECDIAIEGDREFWQMNGSNTTTAQNDITSVMNQVEFIYDRDCELQYNITQIVISTTSVYTSNDAGTLLNEFRNRWNSVHAGIPRDTAHLFTGRQMIGNTIGLAWVGVICNQSQAYGLSESRYTGNFNLRTSLTAHELGHNWNASHCNSQSPCYIMCSSNGGCGGVTLFSPSAIGQITNFAATRSCLTQIPTTPVITNVSSTSVSVFEPGMVTLTGTGFTGITSYRVGTQNFYSGFSVINDNSMNITVPNGTALGVVTFDVTNSLGTSPPRAFIYTYTSPPKLTLTATVPSTGGIAAFDYAGTPGRQWFLLLGISGATTPFQSYPMLSNYLLLGSGTFGPPLGISGVQVPVPAGIGLLIFYAQILEADPTIPAASGTSNVRVIVLL